MDEDRARKLEEAQGFTEHAVEQLSTEMGELSRRLSLAIARLARLEQRLERLASGGDAPETAEDSDQPGDPPP